MLLVFWCVAMVLSVAEGQTISRATCEYMDNPVGIATRTPRFSWELQGAADVYGLKQTSYRLRLALSSEQLAADDCLIDTGRIASAQSTLVSLPATAQQLISGQHYSWDVSLDLVDNQNRTYSNVRPTEPLYFVVGNLQARDWSAKSTFIGLPPTNPANSTSYAYVDCPWCRTVVTLSETPLAALEDNRTRVHLEVASVGYHEPYIAGARVAPGTHLLPAVSYLPKRILSKTYDVTDLVRQNSSFVLGLWLGPGWGAFTASGYTTFADFPQVPLVRAELNMRMPNGDLVLLAATGQTLGTWRCNQSNMQHVGGWVSGNYGGDQVDNRISDTDWLHSDYDDSAWPHATTYDPTLGGKTISPAGLEPTGVLGEVQARHANCTGPTSNMTCVVTMDELFTGWVNVTDMQTTPNGTVTLQYATNEGVTMEFNMMDKAIANAEGRAALQNRFCFHEIQYVTITGLTAPLNAVNMRGIKLGNLRTQRGAFSSSNPLFNAMYNASIDTYRGITISGVSVDCPHRERLGYGGDAHTSLEMALATFDSGAFMLKWAQDWEDVQSWNGTAGIVPHTAPTISGGGGPGWGGFIFTLPWELYRSYGDVAAAERLLPHMRALLGFWLTHVSAEGLIGPFGGYWDFLGDWLTPHGSELATSPDALLFNNNYIALCFRRYAAFTRMLTGNATEAAWAEQWATNLGTAIHTKFYNASCGGYLYCYQGHLLMPLVAETVPSDQVAAIQARLRQAISTDTDSHFDTGLHGTYFLTRYLVLQGWSDDMGALAAQRTFPSYGWFLDQGYTTWPEEWQGAPSRMHGCYNAIGLWFSQGLAGIQVAHALDETRAAQVVCRAPYDLSLVSDVTGDVHTIWGIITSTWTRSPAGLVHHNLTIPGNMDVTVEIPATTSDVHLLNQPVLGSSLTLLAPADAARNLTLTSGFYQIMFQLPSASISAT